MQCRYTCTVPTLACTNLTQNLHLLALILHYACTTLHLPALTLMNFPERCHELQHREVEKTFGATENSTALSTHAALAQP